MMSIPWIVALAFVLVLGAAIASIVAILACVMAQRDGKSVATALTRGAVGFAGTLTLCITIMDLFMAGSRH